MTEEDKVKKVPANPDGERERETPAEEAAERLAKEAGDTAPEKVPEGYDVSVPQNEAEVAKYTPEPDKDGEIHTNAEGDKVKVVDGKATPTEAAEKQALDNQAKGDEAAKEASRDAEAAAEGKKEEPRTSGAHSAGDDEKGSAKAVTDEEKEARLKRAAEARAARAAAKGEGAEGGDKPARAPRAPKADAAEAEPPKPKEPSKKQPQLDRAAALLGEFVGPDAVEEAFINEKNGDMPTLVVKSERWYSAAETLKGNPELAMNYLRNLSGVDQETHLEVVYHLINLTTKQEICVKVKTDREAPVIPSVTPIWSTANWNEREVYDLLGIAFPGHPNLVRIMMSDDWVGHPLRKDYEPLDPEV